MFSGRRFAERARWRLGFCESVCGETINSPEGDVDTGTAEMSWLDGKWTTTTTTAKWWDHVRCIHHEPCVLYTTVHATPCRPGDWSHQVPTRSGGQTVTRRHPVTQQWPILPCSAVHNACGI